jgi:hypothetical protein
MTTLSQRIRECIQHEYNNAEVRLPPPGPLDLDDISYTPDDHNGGYWVQAEVFVSATDLEPNPNPVYTVWECEDFSTKCDWSDVSDWRLDELYQCESDDASGTAARRKAHDRAKYLRRNTGDCSFLFAVKLGNQPPKLLPFNPTANADFANCINSHVATTS